MLPWWLSCKRNLHTYSSYILVFVSMQWVMRTAARKCLEKKPELEVFLLNSLPCHQHWLYEDLGLLSE